MEIIVGIGNEFDDLNVGLCRCVTLLSQWTEGSGIGFVSEQVYIPADLFLSADLRLGDVVSLCYLDGYCICIDKNGQFFSLYDDDGSYGWYHGPDVDSY